VADFNAFLASHNQGWKT